MNAPEPYVPEPHVPEPGEITGDEEVNGPLHPAADAEYLSAAANWLALAEQDTETWQDFRVAAQERTDARMAVTVYGRLAELNIAMASACGGYQYRQRMEEQQRAFTQRVPVQPPSAEQDPDVARWLADLDRKLNGGAPARERPAPCECCAAGLMSLGPGEEKCTECGHGFMEHAAGDTAPTPPEAACDQFVAPQPEVIAADHLCERCGASAAAHVRPLAARGSRTSGTTGHSPAPVDETRAAVDSVRTMLGYLSNSQLREIMNMTSLRLGERGE